MINFWDNPEDFVSNKINCNAWVATAVVGSTVLGGAMQIYSANKAADAQRDAAGRATALRLTGADKANDLLDTSYAQNRADLSPYSQVGQYGIDQLKANPNLTMPIDIPQEMLDLQKPLTIDQKTLETLPGYQFARTQGLKSVQNSAAARGLGVSGAALKGAATFSQGLADQNFNNYFNTEMANRQAAFGRYDTTLGRRIQQNQGAFDRLKSLIDTGAGAAGTTAILGNKVATTKSGNITGAYGGSAGDTIGAGNATAAALNKTGDVLNKSITDIGGYFGYRGMNDPSQRYSPDMSFVKGTAGDQYVPTFGFASRPDAALIGPAYNPT